jgi:hypothetical protein
MLSRTAWMCGRGEGPVPKRAIPNHPPLRGSGMGRRKEGAAAALLHRNWGRGRLHARSGGQAVGGGRRASMRGATWGGSTTEKKMPTPRKASPAEIKPRLASTMPREGEQRRAAWTQPAPDPARRTSPRRRITSSS